MLFSSKHIGFIPPALSRFLNQRRAEIAGILTTICLVAAALLLAPFLEFSSGTVILDSETPMAAAPQAEQAAESHWGHEGSGPVRTAEAAEVETPAQAAEATAEAPADQAYQPAASEGAAQTSSSYTETAPSSSDPSADVMAEAAPDPRASAEQKAQAAAKAKAKHKAADKARPTANAKAGARKAADPSPQPMDLDSMEICTLNINGSAVPYVYSKKTAAAPEEKAGLWLGEDSTTDGSWGYFIGHNPGVFSVVMSLQKGDPVAVCDSDGNTRLYHVALDLKVTDDTHWLDIADQVTTYGESIILQTCWGDNAHYRVVVAV